MRLTRLSLAMLVAKPMTTSLETIFVKKIVNGTVSGSCSNHGKITYIPEVIDSTNTFFPTIKTRGITHV